MKYPLHDAFLSRMRDMLREDFDRFVACYGADPVRGIRANTLKCTPDELARLLPYELSPMSFCLEGFYLHDGQGVGNHPYHHGGLFYVQEPSAMSAVQALAPEPGDRVLDLCAAPGGKSTQIAARLAGEGLLVSNEIVSSRAAVLLSNLERMGVRNAVVTCSHPQQLCVALQGIFDKILVDAPCSGEGMFRKEEAALREWSPEKPQACAARQLQILGSAKEALREGGILVYSTCTFSREENEDVIFEFLRRNPAFELVPLEEMFGVPSGKYITPPSDFHGDMSGMRRIFPFHGGEGHFVAKLRKKGGASPLKFPGCVEDACNIFQEFYADTFTSPQESPVRVVSDRVYLMPKDDVLSLLQGIRVLRAGVLAGRLVKNRFEPEHALFLSRTGKECREPLQLSIGDPRVEQFLRGMEIETDGEKGYRAVCVDSFVLGFGKVSNGRLKNHYPKGLRLV